MGGAEPKGTKDADTIHFKAITTAANTFISTSVDMPAPASDVVTIVTPAYTVVNVASHASTSTSTAHGTGTANSEAITVEATTTIISTPTSMPMPMLTTIRVKASAPIPTPDRTLMTNALTEMQASAPVRTSGS